MKRKEVVSRIFAGMLAFTLAAASGTPSAAVFAADRNVVQEVQTVEKGDQAEQTTWVLMNIPYDKFYEAETGLNKEKVDAFSSATLNKSRTYTSTMAKGSYHKDAKGSDISGVVFPVKVGTGVDLSSYTKVEDSAEKSISVTNRGKESVYNLKGAETLFENADYSYYVLSEAPDYYKELIVDDGGNLSFGKTVGTVNEVSDATAAFTTVSQYGDYQMEIDGIDKYFDSDDTVYGVVIGTTDGYGYGLRHMENIWLQTKLAWCTGFTKAVHNCPTSSDPYKSMMGKTINAVTYYTSKGIYKIKLADDKQIYVPKKFEYTLSVDNAAVTSGKTNVELTGLPADFVPVYSVEGLSGVNVSGSELTYTADSAKNGKYTLKVSDQKGVYAPVSADFELYAESIPAKYDADKTALTAADNSTADDFSAYVKAITSVSVDGRDYAASGRGATVLVNEDGTIKTDAEPIKNTGTYQIVVKATGYKDLSFTYTVEENYKYVYAGLTWAEYWKNENVYNAGSTESSDKEDFRGELDKGAFDTVSRATTNHGLHRGSYQCNAAITMKDGTVYNIAYYPDETNRTKVVLTNGEEITYDAANIQSYVVTGLKYVPVKVNAADYAAFKEKYIIVENGGTLAGGFSEGKLKGYTNLAADVTDKTNGLKTAVKQADGSFTFSERVNGTDSGIKDTALKTAENITATVKPATGSYGEFLRVDLTGDGYGALGADMQAVKWTYYGTDSTYTKPLQSYGTKFASDNWMHKAQGIQLGLTDSLRCKLPEGTDGTGYWTLTVYALGYNDYTVKFEAADENIVKDTEEETVDTTALAEAIKKAETLKESDYTAATWADLQTELKEAKDELAAPHTQATVDEAASHLNAAIKALVKAESKEETKTDVTKLNAAISKAEALKQSDYTADSWKKLQTALDAAKKLTDAAADQTAVDQAASNLETAISALVKADTGNNGTTDKKKKPAVGTVKTVGQIKYKVTGKNTVTVNKYAKKTITKVSIPATVKINGYTFKVTAIADSAFSGCSKLTKVTVGSNVKTIGNKAFYKCTKLTTFTASSTGLNKIGKEAFSGDKKLANITLKTTKLKKSGVGKDAFKNIKKNATFKVPAKKVSDYKAIFKAKGAGKNIKVKKL